MDNLIALFDMDDTLFDYLGSLRKELEKIRAPNEPEIILNFQKLPQHIKNRIGLITGYESFWSEMPKFQLGWDVFSIAEELGYSNVIATKGPAKNPVAWSGKKKCITEHLGPFCGLVEVNNQDKNLIYGHILVDDYPDYVGPWLSVWKESWAILPAHEYNKDYKHPRAIRYDGTNLEEVRKVFQEIKDKTLAKQGPPDIIYL
jgi:hypothetical protein